MKSEMARDRISTRVAADAVIGVPIARTSTTSGTASFVGALIAKPMKP
jgi:hypothetical protein